MIALPTSMSILLRDIVVPAMNIFPESMDSPESRVMLCAITGQESALRYRQQIQGPAHSMWMFERNGISAVLTNTITSGYAKQVCVDAGIAATVDAVYSAMLTDDILGCRFARLLLWSDASALPPIGAINTAWSYYIRNWRPGKPDRNRWTVWYNAAVAAVNAPMIVKPASSEIDDFAETVIQPVVESAAVSDLIDPIEPTDHPDTTCKSRRKSHK